MKGHTGIAFRNKVNNLGLQGTTDFVVSRK